MSALVCDICGGNLAMDASGDFAVCESCGMKHSKERIKVKVQEIKGVVEITKGETEKKRLENNVNIFIEHGDLVNAKKILDILLLEYPQDQHVINLLRVYEKIIISNAFDNLKDILSNTSDLINPEKLKKGIDELDTHSATQKDIINLNAIIKQYAINLSYTIDLSNATFRGIVCYSDLSYNLRKWLESNTNSFNGIYSAMKDIQKKITDIYLEQVYKGTIGVNFSECFGCQLFGIKITEKNIDIDSLVDNKYLIPFFKEGLNNAIKISHYEEKCFFIYGKYRIVYDTGDYGYTSEYYDKSMNEIINERKNERIQKNERMQRRVCQYCGGEFKGIFKKVCTKCGKPKDY